MAGLKSIMTRPVFSRRSRRQADATSSSSNAIGREGGDGTGWEPVVWQAAVVGVVGAAALCLTVWYMTRGRGDEGEEEEEERRKLMAELEARETKMKRDVDLLEKLGASAIRAARREAGQTNQNEAGAAAAHQHDRTDPHHHLDQQAVRVQQLETPKSRLLAKRAREDCQRRRDEIRHMHQILDRISAQGSESASRREQVRIVEDLLGRIEATSDGLTQEMGHGGRDDSADNDNNDGDGDDSDANNKW